MSRFIAGPLYKSRWLYFVTSMEDPVLNNFDSFHFYPHFDETGFTIWLHNYGTSLVKPVI